MRERERQRTDTESERIKGNRQKNERKIVARI